MNTELDKLIKFIAENHRFDAEKYPELQGATDQERLVFAIKHSALHFAKIAGKIATISERVDHGEGLNYGELKTNIAKSLVNTLRLAELANFSGADLIKAVEDQFKEKIEG